jgi:hypothetical protein
VIPKIHKKDSRQGKKKQVFDGIFHTLVSPYQKRLILGEKGVQMCGIQYYTDIFLNDTGIRQKIDISCEGIMI